MTTKIAKSLHLTAGQWRTLKNMMHQYTQSSEDPSVLRVATIVDRVASGDGVKVGITQKDPRRT